MLEVAQFTGIVFDGLMLVKAVHVKRTSAFKTQADLRLSFPSNVESGHIRRLCLMATNVHQDGFRQPALRGNRPLLPISALQHFFSGAESSYLGRYRDLIGARLLTDVR